MCRVWSTIQPWRIQHADVDNQASPMRAPICNPPLNPSLPHAPHPTVPTVPAHAPWHAQSTIDCCAVDMQRVADAAVQASSIPSPGRPVRQSQPRPAASPDQSPTSYAGICTQSPSLNLHVPPCPMYIEYRMACPQCHGATVPRCHESLSLVCCRTRSSPFCPPSPPRLLCTWSS